jgi:hypothetical protein
MLLGYRWWVARKRPRDGWHLRSLAMRVWWDGPHLRALTPPRIWGGWDGESLSCFGPVRCECGIHAFNSEQLALGHGKDFGAWAIGAPQDDYPVWGRVALWGKVVEHQDGYRAEHAMIQRLIVPRGILVHSAMGLCSPEVAVVYPASIMMDYDALGRRYGVEVEVGEGIEIQM